MACRVNVTIVVLTEHHESTNDLVYASRTPANVVAACYSHVIPAHTHLFKCGRCIPCVTMEEI